MKHPTLRYPNLVIPFMVSSLLVFTLAAGCRSNRPTARDTGFSDALFMPEGSFHPQQVNSQLLIQFHLPHGEPNLRFSPSEMQITGFAGCNNYSGSYSISGDTLTFSHVLSTRKACTGVTFEQEYLKIISGRSFGWKMQGNQLILTNRENTLVFLKAKEEQPEE